MSDLVCKHFFLLKACHYVEMETISLKKCQFLLRRINAKEKTKIGRQLLKL